MDIGDGVAIGKRVHTTRVCVLGLVWKYSGSVDCWFLRRLTSSLVIAAASPLTPESSSAVDGGVNLRHSRDVAK